MTRAEVRSLCLEVGKYEIWTYVCPPDPTESMKLAPLSSCTYEIRSDVRIMSYVFPSGSSGSPRNQGLGHVQTQDLSVSVGICDCPPAQHAVDCPVVNARTEAFSEVAEFGSVDDFRITYVVKGLKHDTTILSQTR